MLFRSALTAQLGGSTQLVGDDLFATQADRIRLGIGRRAANAVLIKPNQVGTLSETFDAMALARRHGYRTRIVWLNADRDLCLRRCRDRADHPTLAPEDAEKALALYFGTFRVPSRAEADELEIIGPPPEFVPVTDITLAIGPRRHLIVGDVHGCLDEVLELLGRVGFDPQADVLVCVGDVVDRGPKIRETLEYLFGLPSFQTVLGDHEDRLLRHLEGRGGKASEACGIGLNAE